VLTALYFFDEFDTAAFATLAPDIKRSFDLTDEKFIGLVIVNVSLIVLLAARWDTSLIASAGEARRALRDPCRLIEPGYRPGYLGLGSISDNYGIRWAFVALAPFWIVGGAAGKFVEADVQAAFG
jgi:hypothetical protein